MLIDYVTLPSELAGRDLSRTVCVVLDVLRATTSMAVALTNGCREIRTFGELDLAQQAWRAFDGPKLLVGERSARRPDGFDFGNRPPEFIGDAVKDKTLFMATTNGTRAIVASAPAGRVFVATLANASATARLLKDDGRDVVFVGSGTEGRLAPEDVDGAATIADAMLRLGGDGVTMSDAMRARIADSSWLSNSFGVERLRDTPSGENIIRAQLDADFPFIARVDVLDCLGEVTYGDGFARIVAARA